MLISLALLAFGRDAHPVVAHVFLSLASLLLALVLDHILGEPKRIHPLVLFGNLANRIESVFNAKTISFSNQLKGWLAWLIAVMPLVLCFGWLAHKAYQTSPWMFYLLEAYILYLCIGWRSLKEHMQAIHTPLSQQQIEAARQACAMIVSRDTADLNENQIAKAAIESTLENGTDGIYAAIFWFILLGIPGVVLYRLSNTLDAMWGYRTERFESFGKWSAKMDDVLNWIPARITAFLYIANAFFQHHPNPSQQVKRAWQNWQRQAPKLASPNGGPVMVTGATVLDIELGGPTLYHGEMLDKPFFGGQDTAEPIDIARALKLVDKGLLGWVMVAFVIMIVWY